jgi:hypothetical protein
VVEGLVDGNSEVGIELKHLVQKVHSLGTSARVLQQQVSPACLWECSQVLQSLCIGHVTLVLIGGGSDDLENNSQLIFS